MGATPNMATPAATPLDAWNLPSDAIPGAIEIDGVLFTAIPPEQATFAHDLYVNEILIAIGLDDLATADLAGAAGAKIAAQLFQKVYRSGRAFDLMAALLVEAGTMWSAASCVDRVRAFAGTTNPATKRALADAFAAVLLGFWLTARGSLSTSPTFSVRPTTTAEPATTTPSASAAREAVNGGASITSDAGMPSSDDSPATIPAATPASSHGP